MSHYQRKPRTYSRRDAEWWPVSSTRARKLKRRGEWIRWRPELESMAWRNPMRPKPTT